jgi:hypothetical protein
MSILLDLCSGPSAMFDGRAQCSRELRGNDAMQNSYIADFIGCAPKHIIIILIIF